MIAMCFYVFVVWEIGPQRSSHVPSYFFIPLQNAPKSFSTAFTSETQMCQGETESDLREILTYLSAARLGITTMATTTLSGVHMHSGILTL